MNMEIVPEVSKVVNFLTGSSTAGFIRRILFHSLKQFVHILCYWEYTEGFRYHHDGVNHWTTAVYSVCAVTENWWGYETYHGCWQCHCNL